MPTDRRYYLAAWLTLCGLLAAAFLQVRAPDLRADILALLPVTEQQPQVQDATARMAKSFEQQLLLVLSPEQPATFEELARLARALDARITESALFDPPQPFNWNPETWQLHRYQLTNEQTLSMVRHDPQALLRETERQLFGLSIGRTPIDLEQDPLALHDRYAAGFLPAGVEPITERVFSNASGSLFAPVHLSSSAFDAAASEDLLHWLETAYAWAKTQKAKLQVSGAPRFAAHGAVQARSEISTFGGLSLAGVVVLLVLTFRSLSALVGTFSCIAFGAAAGFAATHLWFDHVHMLTLVFGVSLIGISVDYALHYLCAQLHGEGARTAPGITLAMLSSVAAFASFLATPFPGLQQIAVFSASGLIAAWLTVLGVLPWLGEIRASATASRGMHAISAWNAAWPHVPRTRWMAAGVLALIALGLTTLSPDDDVRALQGIDPELAAEDAEARSRTPIQRASQFFLVQGADERELLRNEASLTRQLKTLGTPFDALSERYPTPGQQRQSYATLKAAYYDTDLLSVWLAELGAGAATIEANTRAFAEAEQVISLERWAEAAPPPWPGHWLGCQAGGCRSVVTLARVDDAKPLGNIRANGVTWVDPAASISDVLARYRVLTSQWLGAVYAVLALVLMTVFGWRGGVRVVAVPLIAVATSLAVNSALGSSFSLFSLLAAMVVIGISLDYGIFYRLHGRSRPSTALAIALSAATTVLAFGMLSFSSTAVVATFGQTLFFGIVAAWLVAPLAGSRKQQTEKQQKGVKG